MLDIYKASAGSGKTYTLTLEYIKLLFQDPQNYRKTLAVTFTNNACGEMKNRILRALYQLSFKDDANYIQELQAEKFNGKTLEKEEIQTTAKKIYKDILHNYSFFYIETIDAFTQNVIRNFAKDLNLPPKFTLELRQNEILETIVKNLLINSLDNEDLHQILIDFAYEDIENSTSTDIKKEIKNESNKFFKELYQEVMTDKPQSDEEIKKNIDRLSQLFVRLEQTKKDTKKQAQLTSDEIQKAINNAGFSISDFKVLMRDTLNIDEVFKSGKFDEKIFVASECCNRGKYIDELSEIYDNGILQKLKRIQELLIEYNTAKKILEHKKGVILSQFIQNELDTYCKQENTFFLAFANKFLKDIINDSDTPFVYEKIGQTIENIMIDEFQDTSKMQWKNFKPIVQNLLSSLKKALIIGDVKQSIYRFRNGNWQLLHNLEHDSELLPYINQETINKLNVNYRSKKNIVQFNNFFFQQYSKKIDKDFNTHYNTNNDTITHIYENCCQEVGKDDGGCVEIHIFEGGKANEAQENLNNALVEKVVSLLKLGRKPDDIVFLCYKNEDISDLVTLFNEKKTEYPDYAQYFSIMSKEALLLNNSLAVQFIICYLKRLIVNEASKDAQFLDSFLTYTFNTLHKTDFDNFSKILELPEYALKPIVQNMSIFETCEHIIENFNLQTLPEETAFLTDFQNIVYSYSKNNNTSISSFLEHWDEIKGKTFLQQAKAHGCMSAATIHSSKGLEYPVVIMPQFIKGKNNNRTALYKTDFDELKLVDLQGNLLQTSLRDKYIEEQYNVEIDDINALYVACTRPKEELYIFDKNNAGKNTFRTILLGKAEKEKKSSKKNQEPCEYEPISPSDFINIYNDYFKNNSDFATIEMSENGFKLGEAKPSEATESNDTIVTKNFTSYTIPKLINNDVESDIEIKLVPEKNSKHFIEALDQPQTEREHGLLMHKILEHINTAADIERYVNQYCPPELFSTEEKREIAEKLKQKITDKRVAHWFDNSWDYILTEQPLLQQNGVEKRPDRMLIKGKNVTIIDYKFGKEQPESYNRQVKEYMNILTQMGYSAQGFIWYVELDDIVTVA